MADMDISRGVTFTIRIDEDLKHSPIWDAKAGGHEAALTVLHYLSTTLAMVGLVRKDYTVAVRWTPGVSYEEEKPGEFGFVRDNSEKWLRFRKDVEVEIYDKDGRQVLKGVASYEGVETDIYSTYRGPEGERSGRLISSVSLKGAYVTFDANDFVMYLNSIGVHITYEELKEKLATPLSYRRGRWL